MNALKLLLEKLCSKAQELRGHIAEIKPMPIPERIIECSSEDSDDPEVKLKRDKIKMNTIDCSNHFMIEIYDYHLK